MRARLLTVLAFLCFCGFAHSQNIRYDNIVFSRSGLPAPGATISVCTQPAVQGLLGQPCAPLANLCSSLTDTVCQSQNPVTADGLGNFFFYIKPGVYTFQINSGPLITKFLPDQFVGATSAAGGVSCATATSGSIAAWNTGLSLGCEQFASTDFLGHLTAASYRANGNFNGLLELTGNLSDPNFAPAANSFDFIAPSGPFSSYRMRMPSTLGAVSNCPSIGSQTTGTNGPIDNLIWIACSPVGFGTPAVNAPTYGTRANNILSATGSINGGSGALSLTTAPAYVPSQWLDVVGAGPACGNVDGYVCGTAPTPVGTYFGAAGATTYTIKIVQVDLVGGGGIVSAASTVNNAVASITPTNWIRVTWTPTASQEPIYGVCVNGNPVGVSGTSQFNYMGQPTLPANNIFPAAFCTAVAQTPELLRAQITAGAGTASLTLGTNASQTVASAAVFSDDSGFLQAMVNAANTGAAATTVGYYNMLTPEGNYTLQSSVKIPANMQHVRWTNRGQLKTYMVVGAALVFSDIFPADAQSHNLYEGIQILGQGASGAGATNNPAEDGAWIFGASDDIYRDWLLDSIPHEGIVADKAPSALGSGFWTRQKFDHVIIRNIGQQCFRGGMTQPLDDIEGWFFAQSCGQNISVAYPHGPSLSQGSAGFFLQASEPKLERLDVNSIGTSPTLGFADNTIIGQTFGGYVHGFHTENNQGHTNQIFLANLTGFDFGPANFQDNGASSTTEDLLVGGSSPTSTGVHIHEVEEFFGNGNTTPSDIVDMNNAFGVATNVLAWGVPPSGVVAASQNALLSGTCKNAGVSLSCNSSFSDSTILANAVEIGTTAALPTNTKLYLDTPGGSAGTNIVRLAGAGDFGRALWQFTTDNVSNNNDFMLLGPSTGFNDALKMQNSAVGGLGGMVQAKYGFNSPPIGFGSFTACSGTTEGALRAANDANVGVLGQTVTSGGGSNHVLVYCNATNPVVVGGAPAFSASVAASTTLLAANTCGDIVTVTVTGATTTMEAHASGQGALPTSGLVIQAAVTSANQVSVQYCNVTTAGITPTALTIQVRVTP